MNGLKIYIILLLFALLTGCKKSTPPPASYAIFKGTPVEELAYAVRSNNIAKIKKLVLEDSVDINYQEEKYGFTVLMTALCHRYPFNFFERKKIEVVEVLLQLGADPNLFGDLYGQWGKNPVLVAAGENNYEGLKLLLEYGGDPNSRTRRRWGTWRNDDTALIANLRSLSGNSDIRCFKLLLEYGADINAKSEYLNEGVLDIAMIFKLKAVQCIIEAGVDPNTKILYRPEGKMISLVERLRYMTFPLDSKDYQIKLEVIEYLKTKGIDYYSCPVPEDMLERIKLEYPDNWEEYLQKY